jgi:hypothetical protein
MKSLKSSAASCVLSLLLTITALGGDMPGPGIAQTGPPTISTESTTATCEPVTNGVSAAGAVNRCEEATPNPINEAMIIAIQLLTSVW